MIVGIFDGIIKKFNEKFPRQGVKKFDKITAVNGKVGTANEMRRTEDAHLKTPQNLVDLQVEYLVGFDCNISSGLKPPTIVNDYSKCPPFL